MKKKILIAILLILISFIFITKQSNNVKTDKPIVNIGAILPLTGRVAEMGEGSRNAISMAVEEENKNPNHKFHYNVLFEDDQLTISKTAMSANKLINVNKVNALISFFSNAGLLISTLADENKIIHFANTWNADVAQKSLYSFIHQTQSEEVVDKFVSHAKSIGIKKIAVLTSTNSGTYVGAVYAKEEISKNGMQVSSFEKFNDGERFFNPIIEKAKTTNPDIYLIMVLPPELDLIIKQMHELGINNDKITTVAYFDISKNKNLFNGSWEATVSNPNKDFLNSYINKYDTEPAYGTAFSYDIAKLIVFGYENTEAKDGELYPTNEDVIKKLKQVKDFEYSIGRISIDSDGVVHSKASIKKVEDGKIIPVNN